MPIPIARIVLAIVFIGSTPFVYWLLFEIIENLWLPADEDALLASNVVSGFYLIFGWMLVWRGTVKLTGERIRRTLLVLLVSVAVGVGITLGLGRTRRQADAVFVLLGGLGWSILWLVGSTLVWTETRQERVRRIAYFRHRPLPCPNCRYNLVGLHEARCPECGTQYTLDEIVASVIEQTGRMDFT